MSKHIFKPLSPKGNRLPEEAFTPLIYIAGTQTHRLALHRELNRAQPVSSKEWMVSEPISGAQILAVRSHYKGLPCSSRGLGVRDARGAAMNSLDQLVGSIGSDKFNATLAKAIAQYGEKS